MYHGGSLWRKIENKIKRYSLSWCGSFPGEKPMREAFEELIERQTCGQFEKWRQHRETAEKAA